MAQAFSQGIRVGGSALPDGVMMLTPLAAAIAREAPDGTLHVESFALPQHKPLPIEKLPFIRILPRLFRQMSVVARGWKPGKGRKAPVSIVAVALAIGIVSTALNAVFSNLPSMWHAMGSSFLQLSLFLGVIGATRLVPKFGRIWRFHGGEHQAIATYEAGMDLTLANTSRQTLYHPRCGTNLATLSLVLMIPGMVSGSVIAGMLGYLITLLVPLAALCVAFEIVMFGQTRMRVVLWPGLAFQRLTVLRPGRPESLAGIAALEGALAEHERVMRETAEPSADELVEAHG